MITFDFAGGIGTALRVLPPEGGGFTVGVLVLSNFGRLRNLTVDGAVVGRALDGMFPHERRRTASYGSAVVVVATDAPLLSSQLSRLAKRAALGLGRVGSHAASSSGEIVLVFSTANRTPRTAVEPRRFLTLRFVADAFVNPLYEAVIEATEEAVLNAMLCSRGVAGQEGRSAPAIPQDTWLELLAGLARRGMTMGVVTHDLAFARQVADQAHFLDEGQIVESGPPATVLDDPREDRTRAFMQSLAHRA